MENPLGKEVQSLKEDWARKKEEVQNISDLVREKIDRHFQPDLQELSERELELFIQEKMATFKQYIHIHPDPMALTSHRKILGRPILFLKRKFIKLIRFYFQLITSRQTQFNENSALLLEAIIIRLKRNRQELQEIQERICRLEETIVLLLARLKGLKEEQHKQESRSANEITTRKQ